MGHTSLMVQKILRGTEGNLRLENINPDLSLPTSYFDYFEPFQAKKISKFDISFSILAFIPRLHFRLARQEILGEVIQPTWP